MKFYKRFPGDIMKKTSGLTMAQFGAYDRLIDWCYANEQPVDPDEVYTITHAQTPADRRDVDKVLAKFFQREPDGYRQERIEEVIAEALPKIEAARENGKKGGRPPKPKPTGLLPETQDATEAVNSLKAIQSQSISSPKKLSKASPSHPPSAGRFAEFWHAWPKSERKQDRKACAAKWKLHGLDAQCDAILVDLATKRQTTKWQEGYIEAPLVYLNNERWLDGVTPDGGKPGEAAKPWHDTRSGIVAKGVELGLGGWTEAEWVAGRAPDFVVYRTGVYRAAGHREAAHA
jgi:uncharacterized protein YdaU (DUF1376 family)